MEKELAVNSTVSHYRIVAKIGAGGMGEVYRAVDERLDREVAIKVLPHDVAGDEDRLRRFEQEAKATSALNHPNILTVYDIGEHEGVPFIVSELLVGDELRDRLNEGPIPLRKTIDYAQQVVSGLAAAHERGIVHRDLKPENLFITKDDRVKILDFGLAKLRERPTQTQGSEDATRRALTDPGIIMGTVGYMSPEQVRGHALDARSDIFSFGAILYEMITGRRAFDRETMAESMSAILKEEPEDLTVSNPNISPALDRIVQRCLEKKADQRFHSAHDLGFALESLSVPTSPSGSHMTTTVGAFSEARKSSWFLRLIPWGIAALFCVGCVGLALLYVRRQPADLRPARFVVNTPDKATEFAKPTISPDGRTLAFVGTVAGKRFIYVRPLDSLESRPLPGTEEADYPFWSPDSRYLGFFSNGKLRKVEAAGGPVQTLCDVVRPSGGTWNKDGVIVFSSSSAGGLQRVQASGGSPVAILPPDDPIRETDQSLPTFLPDGKHFLFLSWRGSDNDVAICAGSIEGSVSKLILSNYSNALYVSPGFLLFARENTLMAQAFDPAKLELSGEPVPVLEGVVFNQYVGLSNFSVSDNGTMFYWAGLATDRQLAWFDRTGKQLSTLGPRGDFSNIDLSPDEKKVVVQGGGNLWQMDVARGLLTRFTFSSDTYDDDPSWSGDGGSIMFTSYREGARNIYRKPSNGNAIEELVAKINTIDIGSDWSSDSQYFLFTCPSVTTAMDLWVLPVSGGMKPYPLLQSTFSESQGKISPDGRWFAYTSDESGTNEIYVQSFPAPGGKWQVSTSGGAQPMWRKDGKEIFYVTPDRKLMAVEVKADSAFETGVPVLLFQTTVPNFLAPDRIAVSSDGQRFLVNSTSEDTSQTSMTVILNWTAGLQK